MKSLIFPTLQDRVNEVKPFIKNIEGDVEDFASGSIQRMRFVLVNGYSISVVKGFGTYSGSRDNTFEMAVINPQGDLDYQFTEGDVLGHQTVEDLINLIKTVVSAKS